MGWLIAAAVITLLAIAPLGVWVRYDLDGLLLKLIAGPVKLTLIPGKKKEKPQEEEKKPAKTQVTKSAAPKEKKGGSITDFLPLVQLALDLLGDVRRKLRVRRLELLLVMAGDDPCDLAVNYGRAWAAVGNLMPQLERLFVIKKKDVQVACDFTADKTTVFARVDITITLGRLLALVTMYGIKALREWIKINNLRKGGAVQ
jgi:hypothetical protein